MNWTKSSSTVNPCWKRFWLPEKAPQASGIAPKGYINRLIFSFTYIFSIIIFANRQRLRSKSVIGEDLPSSQDGPNKPFPLRRQSAISDIKAKVSKWTKVKAAFRWESANVTAMNEGKSTDSGINIGLSPVNYEVARFVC